MHNHITPASISCHSGQVKTQSSGIHPAAITTISQPDSEAIMPPHAIYTNHFDESRNPTVNKQPPYSDESGISPGS